IRGRELVELGLASAALPADQVLEATLERAREVLKAAPVSVAISKRLLWRGLSISSAELGPKEALMFAWTSSQADAREGVASFLEKRDPDWKLSVAKNTPEIGL
ncbi:MAG: crotonase, partial [Proteobacteria bacterium]|nr:crotonase [Pseudomonadota bacterium]